jgi:uncharacterized protein
LSNSGRNWVSNRLPSREQAIQLLKENNCPTNVRTHCKYVSKLAVETAKSLQKKGFVVDIDLVETGGLLHDLGRSKTHTVNHAVAGAEIAKAAGIPEPVIAIIKRHVGGGITKAEAKELGWPEDNYIPVTLEEKIVSYADKLIETSKRVPVEDTINKLREKKLVAAAERVKEIHEEITNLIGEKQ